VASAAAVLFWWVLAQNASFSFVAGLLLLLTVLGVFLIRTYEKLGGEEDASEIVIDEWVGMGIAMVAVAHSWILVIVAFGLFRLFDIWKPPGVRYFDRHYLEGWGVMLDDVVAGMYAAVIVGAIARFI